MERGKDRISCPAFMFLLLVCVDQSNTHGRPWIWYGLSQTQHLPASSTRPVLELHTQHWFKAEDWRSVD